MFNTGMEAMKEKGSQIGSRLWLILKVVIVCLAIFGAFSLVDQVSAFFNGAGFEPVEMIQVGDITSILIDENGDAKFDIQVSVASLSALRNIETGEVSLTVMGKLPASEQ